MTTASKRKAEKSKKHLVQKPAAKRRAVSSPKKTKVIAGQSKTHAAQTKPDSKLAIVLQMLDSPAGTTIAAMMKATGWQQHSVRGFLAGTVKTKLGLKLVSNKVDGTRTYRIAKSGAAK